MGWSDDCEFLPLLELGLQQQTHIIQAVDMLRKATQMDPTQPKYWDELAIASHKYPLEAFLERMLSSAGVTHPKCHSVPAPR